MANNRQTGDTAKEIKDRISEKRVGNLRKWIDETYFGNVALFCREQNLTKSRASYISQLLSGHRSMGENAARALEADCGKHVGFLDGAAKPRPRKTEAEEQIGA